MCGRYSLAKESVEVTVGTHRVRRQGTARYNIAPTQRAPVIRRNTHGLVFDDLRWGLVPESPMSPSDFRSSTPGPKPWPTSPPSGPPFEVGGVSLWLTGFTSGRSSAAPSNPGDSHEQTATSCCSPVFGNRGHRSIRPPRSNPSPSSPRPRTPWSRPSTTGCRLASTEKPQRSGWNRRPRSNFSKPS